MLDYLPELLKGLHTSLTLTVASIIVALILSLIFTIILTLKTPGLVWIVRGYITLFTGTPLLVQIFLIYYGPGQFPSLQEYPWLWHLISEPWLCALIALSLNSAAYTTQLFYGAIRAIPDGQWQSCSALGMNKKDTLAILLPYALSVRYRPIPTKCAGFQEYLSGLHHHADGSDGPRPAAVWTHLRRDGVRRRRDYLSHR
ncbi:Arginine ABC transporter [Klebsiella pneumoniae]|uniref:Arginine ABC transporter permease protein ArtM n=1 Tax=Klebsiella pneumoniae TaxID=573 RepID=A0A2X3EXT0_KLEPN|nr:Arginine ABC transporter [Klebsiella pneumoniae]